MKIATYRHTDYNYTSISEADDYNENHEDRVRLTEIVEVEFVDLPAIDVLQPQVDAIDRKIAEANAKHTIIVQSLKDDKQKLLAITHEPQA